MNNHVQKNNAAVGTAALTKQVYLCYNMVVTLIQKARYTLLHYHYSTQNAPCQGENVEILHDKSPSGKERPWHVRKLENQYISAAYEEVNAQKAGRLSQCAAALLFTHKDGGGLKLKHANFCRVRLCPICAWRRSLKTQAHMNKILQAAEPQKLEYLLVTLTLRNCSAAELGKTLDVLMRGYKNLVIRRRYKQAWLGWYRGVEVTHNVQQDTYHPHIHALVAVKPSYFKKTDYIKQADLAQDWREVCKIEDYTPIVDIRKVKLWSGGQARTRTDIIKAVNEVAKYTTKSSDIICFDDWDFTVNTVRVLDAAFDKRRFIAYGGLFKELHKQLNLDDTEDGDLVHVDDSSEDGGSSDDELLFWWHTGYCRYVR